MEEDFEKAFLCFSESDTASTRVLCWRVVLFSKIGLHKIFCPDLETSSLSMRMKVFASSLSSETLNRLRKQKLAVAAKTHSSRCVSDQMPPPPTESRVTPAISCIASQNNAKMFSMHNSKPCIYNFKKMGQTTIPNCAGGAALAVEFSVQHKRKTTVGQGIELEPRKWIQ